mmetsp:Transcript_42457/g.117142  ORF Transcript_42457/g.117142 Transcript_42457/m.117142 type:complete len:174 (-) Transcript_42457:10-531(-)
MQRCVEAGSESGCSDADLEEEGCSSPALNEEGSLPSWRSSKTTAVFPSWPLPSNVRVGNLGGDTLLELHELDIVRVWNKPLARCVAEILMIDGDGFQLVLDARVLDCGASLCTIQAVGHDGDWDFLLIDFDLEDPFEALMMRRFGRVPASDPCAEYDDVDFELSSLATEFRWA